jgi:hypothetical protein
VTLWAAVSFSTPSLLHAVMYLVSWLVPLNNIHEGQSIYRPQMDIKSRTCDIRTWKKALISRNILHQHWYTCPIALPVRRNSQHMSLLTVMPANSAPPFQHLRLLNVRERILQTRCEPLYATNTSHRKLEIFLDEYPLHWVLLLTKNAHQNPIFRYYTPKHGRHFDYWNDPLIMRMRVCNLDCHETGLYSYLVIHIENLLLPLQLFYFHLWSTYWLFLILQERVCFVFS